MEEVKAGNSLECLPAKHGRGAPEVSTLTLKCNFVNIQKPFLMGGGGVESE